MPIGVNESVIKRRHDLLQAIPLEQYSPKNAVALSKGNKKFSINPGSELSGSFLTQDCNWYILFVNIALTYRTSYAGNLWIPSMKLLQLCTRLSHWIR